MKKTEIKAPDTGRMREDACWKQQVRLIGNALGRKGAPKRRRPSLVGEHFRMAAGIAAAVGLWATTKGLAAYWILRP